MPDFDGNDIPPSPPLPTHSPTSSPRWPFTTPQPAGSVGRQILHGLIGNPQDITELRGRNKQGFSGLLAGLLGSLMGLLSVAFSLIFTTGLFHTGTSNLAVSIIVILLTAGTGLLFLWVFGRLAIESFIIIARALRQTLSPRR